MFEGMIVTVFVIGITNFGHSQSGIGVKVKSIYEIKTEGLGGKPVDFSNFKGKTLLIFNAASRCGYTPQYKALQKLHTEYKSRGLVVIGVPSNDFKQELESGEKIEEFCKLNYGVDFQMLKSTSVTGEKKSELFKFLVENGPAPQSEVKWNFEKFLVDSTGHVVARFGSKEAPDSLEFLKHVTNLLESKK